jgi:hypothetical protein
MATEIEATQREWNAVARAEALAEFGAVEADEIVGGAAEVGRLFRDRRAFAVGEPHAPLLPAFQFLNGTPRPIIERVLGALGDEMRGWEILAWFTGSSDYPEGAGPVDLLDVAADDVVAAAGLPGVALRGLR